MDKPRVADTCFMMMDLKPGTYHWCQCGQSKKQPFCDGSHKSTSFQPVKFEVAEAKRVRLCMCKQTKKAPYCDGSHSKL